MSTGPLGNIAKKAHQLNLLGEKRKREGKRGEEKKKETKRRERKENRKVGGGKECKKKREKKKQNSKIKQMYVETIYIYSGIAAANEELQEKQLNI